MLISLKIKLTIMTTLLKTIFETGMITFFSVGILFAISLGILKLLYLLPNFIITKYYDGFKGKILLLILFLGCLFLLILFTEEISSLINIASESIDNCNLTEKITFWVITSAFLIVFTKPTLKNYFKIK